MSIELIQATAPSEIAAAPLKRAVLYLRVSLSFMGNRR